MEREVQEVEELFTKLHQTSDPQEREAVRRRIILANMGLVRSLASKFLGRGEPFEDLVQVGTVGLISAVDRFEPKRGIRFATFAYPTILGEIRRYFRDKGWTVRIPRRLQELRFTVNNAIDRLSQQLKRSPKIIEIAAEVQISEEDVMEVLEIEHMYDVPSLDRDQSDGSSTHVPVKGVTPPELEWRSALLNVDLTRALTTLPYKERRVIEMKFFKNMTQVEIAKELNISQMHVSRLQRQAINTLRKYFEEEEEE